MTDMPPLLTADDSAHEGLLVTSTPAAVSGSTPAVGAAAGGAGVAAAGSGVQLSSSSGRLSTSSPSPPPLLDASDDDDDVPELTAATDDSSGGELLAGWGGVWGHVYHTVTVLDRSMLAMHHRLCMHCLSALLFGLLR
jgi:hypothetical protein